MNKNIYLIAVIFSILGFSSCKDQFSDINTDDEKTPPKIEYLFTGALSQMNGQNYYSWFWNYNALLPWTQIVASAGGNTEQLATMMDLFEDFNHMIDVKRQLEAVKHVKSQLPVKQALIYSHLEAICYPITIYMGLIATDGSGSIPYSEAAKGYIEGESAFKPKFDNQESLYKGWLDELKNTITILSNKVYDEEGKEVPQINIGSQDFVYQGDIDKWIKFTNSLRLKIAVRLLHQNRSYAEEIVADIIKYPLILTPEDDFLWSPGSQWNNSTNNFQLATGSKHVIEFLIKNKDPRVRFLFYKNDYNENIINGFLAAKKALPSYIDKLVELEIDAEGNKKFKNWKSPGEPWVRYHGVPVDLKSKEYPQNMADYYNIANRELGTGTSKKSYAPWSGLGESLLRGSYKYVYPALPGETPQEYTRNENVTFNYMSAGEVNLYLAELKVLGFNNLAKTAEEYYKNGVRFSVMMYNTLAQINKIPYYDKVNGLPDSDKPIALKDGEIEELLMQPDYQLTGSKVEQLERIYVQMYFHFTLYPADLFTTVRRSGVPMKNSNYFSLAPWDSKTGEDLVVPRRFQVRSLSETDELYEERKEAYLEQGLTPGKNDPATLNEERLWSDKGAPNYGEGPNY